MIKYLLILIGIFMVVFILRYLVLRDLDFGFSLIMAILLLFIYFIINRLVYYMRRKEV
jgi:hypothetical protein